MKTFKQIREATEKDEGYVSAAQRKAVWASRADKKKGKNEARVECPKCEGKGCDHCDNKGYHTEDSDAVKAFLAKGGKIKKLPPAKAQGYHGKDDPGKSVHGMMNKPDSRAMGTRKKVRSMK